MFILWAISVAHHKCEAKEVMVLMISSLVIRLKARTIYIMYVAFQATGAINIDIRI